MKYQLILAVLVFLVVADVAQACCSFIIHPPVAAAPPPPPPPPPPPRTKTTTPIPETTTTRPAVSPPGMTASKWEWYLRQGFPVPKSNPDATGYLNFLGVGNYKVHRGGKSWDKALEICASEGSILAVIDNNAEATVIKQVIIGATMFGNFVTISDMYYYWIGAKEFGTNMRFRTILGEYLGSPSYLNWSPVSPQPDEPGNFDCVGFMHDGHNFDAECAEEYGFVCEKVI